MNKLIPTYLLIIDEELSSELQVDAVAMVDAPAIERNFLQFRKEFVQPNTGEKKDDFISRCISYVVNEGKDTEQAVAICNSLWNEHFAAEKISIDYDDTLSTDKGKELAKKIIANGATLYIISARDDKGGMLSVAESLGIPNDRVFATGSNKAKVQKIKDLGIKKHYDNNADVVKELNSVGYKFEETYNDYPEQAKENAKIALRWAKEKFSNKLSFAINEDKQEIFGPAMLADVPIYRNDKQLGEYNVVFDKATIYKIAQKFFEKDFNKNFNIMHDPNQKCKGVYAFQSYIVDSEEGRPAPKGYEDAKDGSWFLGVKVNNAEVWSKIKSGEIKGFSVEGVFEYKKKELNAGENVKCSNCNHSWNTSESKQADKYVCHKCGFDNTAKEMYYQIQKLLEELDS